MRYLIAHPDIIGHAIALPEAEYEDEHLPGAINVPLKTLDAESARRLERERPVIVYCHDYQ